jgi:hypothetical protein
LVATFALALTACGGPAAVPSASRHTSVSTTTSSATTTTPQPRTTTTTTTTTIQTAPPTAQQITAQITDTHEESDPSENFVGGTPVTVGDGNGGFFTAEPALRNPSADGHGDLIFFWHNQTFLGWDTNKETWDVTVRANGPDTIAATYPDYRPNDAACCPSLPPVTITYSWGGTRLAQSQSLPAGTLVGVTVAVG